MPKLVRHLAGVQSAAAAEGDQREVARIVTALHRNQTNGPLHIGVGDAQDALAPLERG